MKIIVVGAGIVGMSCAIWLQRDGHDVTLIDRSGPASGTSHGNAGVLAAGAIVPVTTPGLISKAPRMLLDRDSPLFLRWSYALRLLPFLRRYLSYATEKHVAYYAEAMETLLHDSHAQHLALARGTGAEKFVHNSDYCFGYRTRDEFEEDAYGWEKRKAAGFIYKVVSGSEFAQFDPAYGDAFETVVRCKGHGRISDPGAYVKALGVHFLSKGGRFEQLEVRDIVLQDGVVTALDTQDGPRTAQRIVLAMGPWSKKIAHKLGVQVPLESERGYHIDFMSPSVMPKAPMMIAAGKFVLTPMEGRLRAAGVLEFGGLENGPSPEPFAMLRRHVARVLPGLECKAEVEWMGHRPAPADSLPLIGANDPKGISYSAFGHQHVGLTGGPKTGRIISQMIGGITPNIDMRPFDPQKYKAQ